MTIKFAGASHAPGNGITITTIAGPALIGDIDTRSKIGDHEVKIKSKGLSDVCFAHGRIVPGGHSPWHSHPGPSILAIKSGTAAVYQRSAPDVPQIVNAGESFVEDATLVHQVVNEGDTDLEFFVLQIVPFGARGGPGSLFKTGRVAFSNKTPHHPPPNSPSHHNLILPPHSREHFQTRNTGRKPPLNPRPVCRHHHPQQGQNTGRGQNIPKSLSFLNIH